MEEEEFLKSLLIDFKKESNDFIETIESNILEFEKSKDDNLIRIILQTLHSIKGSAAAADLESIAELAHSIEEKIQKSTDHEIDTWLKLTDELAQKINNVEIS